jgi:hypothetical protein
MMALRRTCAQTVLRHGRLREQRVLGVDIQERSVGLDGLSGLSESSCGIGMSPADRRRGRCWRGDIRSEVGANHEERATWVRRGSSGVQSRWTRGRAPVSVGTFRNAAGTVHAQQPALAALVGQSADVIVP